jgi:hypothetical protein
MNYNTTLAFMLSCVGFQIVTGIFLVCSTVLMHISFSERGAFMRDVLMDGLLDISCKWRFILLYRGIRPFVTRIILRVLFLSDDSFGALVYYLITDDINFFLGYVLLGDK